jgi:hypothetical protein
MVDCLLSFGQQIEQEGPEAILLQRRGDEPIPGTSPAAPAAMGKDHEAARVGRHDEIGIEAHAVRGDLDTTFRWLHGRHLAVGAACR